MAMLIVLLIVGVLFFRVLLSLIYCITNLISTIKAIKHGQKPLWSYAFMGFSGIMLFMVNFPDYYYTPFLKPTLAAIFLVLIHICAIVNSKTAGEKAIRPHVLRLIVSVLIFVLFCMTSHLNDTFVWRAIFGLD